MAVTAAAVGGGRRNRQEAPRFRPHRRHPPLRIRLRPRRRCRCHLPSGAALPVRVAVLAPVAVVEAAVAVVARVVQETATRQAMALAPTGEEVTAEPRRGGALLAVA